MPDGRTNDKELVQKTIEGLLAAIGAKDIKRMMAHYASDVVVFDVKPPFQTNGAIAWRHTWEACFPYFPDAFGFTIRDMVIHTSGNLAFAHYLFSITGPDKDHAAMQTWMRATTGLKFTEGKWKIVHEHGSLPYDPITMQAVSTLEVR